MRQLFSVQAGQMAAEEGGKAGHLDQDKSETSSADRPLILSLVGSETKFASTGLQARESLC